MCYSKEVSLLAGTFMASGCGFAYFRYYLQVAKNAAKKALQPCFGYMIIAILCISMHEVFEYFAILTNNQLIYKAGLMFSISCVYFLIRSLEALSGIRFGSRVFIVLIALTGLYMLTQKMDFENKHFFVRGYSHFWWSAVWAVLFFYWNVCTIFVYRHMPSKTNRKILLLYPWFAFNVSYTLTAIYAYAAAYYQHGLGLKGLCALLGIENLMQSFQVVYDSQSIWCVLVSTHAVLVPILCAIMMRSYDPSVQPTVKSVPASTTFIMILISFAIWFAFFFTIPLFPGITYKMLAL